MTIVLKTEADGEIPFSDPWSAEVSDHAIASH
jgi:hypothetical protein